MRYMGDAAAGLLTTPLDPTSKAVLLANAATLPDERARDLLEISDATPLGKRAAWVRVGLGAAGGLLAGLVLARLRKKR